MKGKIINLSLINFIKDERIKLSFLKIFCYLASITFTIILVKSLSPSDLGIFYYILAISGILTFVFGLGNSDAIVPIISNKTSSKNEVWLSMLIFGSILGFLLFAILNSINLFFDLFSNNIELFIWYATLIAPFKIIQLNLYYYFLSQKQLFFALIMNEGNGRNFLILSFLIYFFLLDYDLSLNLILKIFAASSALIVILGMFLSFESFKGIKYESLRNYVKLGLKFYPSQLSLNSTSDLFDIFINNIFGPIALASFSLAKRLTYPLLFFTDLVQMYFTRASNLYFENKNIEIKKLHRSCIIYSLSLTILASLFYSPILFTVISDFLNFDSFENIKAIIFICFLGVISQSVFVFSKLFLRFTGKYIKTSSLDFGVIIFGSITFLILSTYSFELSILGPIIVIALGIIKNFFAYFLFSKDIE